ncbi:MAG: penicillin-binding protein 2, partial [Elusimicrobia bacterium]|nr:penicillin-binding protein 2 [Elusimicrobiota bacterium]
MSREGGRERLEPLWWAIAAVGAVLGLRLVQLQLVDSAEYRLAAERNRSEVIYQTAPRGRLYDRRGDPIATNRGAFSLIFLPGKNRSRRDLEPLALELGRQLGRDPKDLLETLEQAERDQSVVRLAENLPKKTMFQLSELKTLYPGVDLIEEATRYYPHGRFASHLIGFMGKINPAQWRALAPEGYRPDERVGQMGLERVFERELRGRDGGKRMEVDAQGRLKRELESIPWQAGGNVYLTIDTPVQEAADEGLRRTDSGRGAAVAIDPRNGELIALSSQPDFDPNALLSTDAEQASKAAATLPEFDKAIAGTYPPGSTFKPIVGLAALSSGRITPDQTFFCPGWFKLGQHVFKCWDHKGHGKVSFLYGLEQSCDVYFYNVGLRTGGALIEKYEREFGLGSKTNVALRGESAGHVFGPAQRRLEGRGWYDGDTVNLSIGQGELLVTPIQMAVVAAALANRGTVWRPHYTRRVVFADGRPDYVQKPEILGRVEATDAAWDEIQEGMQLVVSSGTGYDARIPGLLVAGKTGTAQNPHGQDHGWFIAYAARPGEPASIAVAVLVENGGHGGVTAAPVAKRMIEAYFGIPDPEEVRAQREAARRKAKAAAEAALRSAGA